MTRGYFVIRGYLVGAMWWVFTTFLQSNIIAPLTGLPQNSPCLVKKCCFYQNTPTQKTGFNCLRLFLNKAHLITPVNVFYFQNEQKK